MSQKRKNLEYTRETKIMKYDLPLRTTFELLPKEMILKIISYLNFRDIRHLLSTCRRFRTMTPLVSIPKFEFGLDKLFKETISSNSRVFISFDKKLFDRHVVPILNRYDKIKHLSFTEWESFAKFAGEKYYNVPRSPISILKKFENLSHVKKITLSSWVLRSNAFESQSLDSICPNLQSVSLNSFFVPQIHNLNNMFKYESSWNRLLEFDLKCRLESKFVCLILKRCTELQVLNLKDVKILKNDGLVEDEISILKTITSNCKKLKTLRLPTNRFWTNVTTEHLLLSDLNLKALSGNVVDWWKTYSSMAPNISQNTQKRTSILDIKGKNIIQNLTILQSCLPRYYTANQVCPVKQNWLISNISENLVVFDCIWFFLLQKYVISLSKACPNLKMISGSLHREDSKGYFLRLLRKYHPKLVLLRLDTRPKNGYDCDFLKGESKIYIDENDFIDTLEGYTSLKVIHLVNNSNSVSKKTKQRIFDMGIKFIDH